MSKDFTKRLNQVKDRLMSDELLTNSGLGNEIGFYIFDYPPEFELEVRKHLEHILPQMPINVSAINLFELLVDYLKREDIYDSAKEMQIESGDTELANALEGVLEGGLIAPEIVRASQFEENDLILIYGIGNSYPLLRTHDLLNNLQPILGNTPLVIFYPGKYSGQTLSLFGKLKDENYYRAFRLVP